MVRGEADRERSPSVDLAAGLRSSGHPEKATLDADLEASLAHYLPEPAGASSGVLLARNAYPLGHCSLCWDIDAEGWQS